MTTPTFQPAHSQEQRAHRPATILDATTAMLAEMRAGQVVPELSEPAAWQFAGTAVMMTGALWTHSRPSAAVEAAYQAHDDLAAMRLDFTSALRGTLTTLLAGLLARPPH